MKEFILPQKEAAALMPGASYSVPGLFLFSDLIYQCLDQVKAKFDYAIPIKYMYGAPRVLWNCGRLIIREQPYTTEEIRAELSGAVEHGIIPLLTFSSTDIRPEELSDPACNAILAILDELRGGVIVSDPRLKAYVEENYPHVEIHASVIMTAFEKNRDQAYYQSLARDFSRYVVHPDDNHDPDLLAQIPKEKAEIIVNERCGYQCAQRREHYLSITEEQRDLIETGRCGTNFIEHCQFIPEWKQKGTKRQTISLTAQDAAKLSRQGFDLFKLQGRLDSPYVFFFDFLRYTLENQVAFPTMFPIFSYTIRGFEKERAKRRERERGQG